ncbi:MAG TPA: PASTA domain-containing protein [Gemmatimonadaceae bacterium]|nr:PASTA domain-containing protein [Gemmatimonadaceae bacterium]
MTRRTAWQRAWPFLAAAVGGLALAWVLIIVFVFPPGAAPGDATVPNVIGLSFDVASQRLQQAGFKPQRGELRFAEAVPRMSVIQMTPDQGTTQPVGSTVVLDLSNGPRMGTVPNVVGMPPAQADSALAAAGFSTAPDTVTQASDQPVGTVIATRPGGGSAAPVPSAVTLVLSAGPATITVPDLSGRTIVEARILLEQLGLALGDVTILNGGGGQDQATVVQQNPAAGTLAPPGARVTVSVSGGTAP